MTRTQELIEKLADTMDRDHARAFVGEVISEVVAVVLRSLADSSDDLAAVIRQYLADHDQPRNAQKS